MAIDKVIEPLRRVPLFAGLNVLQIAEIGSRAERIAFRSGNPITMAGTLGDGAYVIVSGEALRLPDPGSTAPPQLVESGSLVGELAMLIDHVYGATVVANTRVHGLKIMRAALYEQMQADPALADHFSQTLANRLAQVATEMRRIDDLLAAAAQRPAQALPASGSVPA